MNKCFIRDSSSLCTAGRRSRSRRRRRVSHSTVILYIPHPDQPNACSVLWVHQDPVRKVLSHSKILSVCLPTISVIRFSLLTPCLMSCNVFSLYNTAHTHIPAVCCTHTHTHTHTSKSSQQSILPSLGSLQDYLLQFAPASQQ